MTRNLLGNIAAAIAGLGMLLPPSALAKSPTAPMNDVALRAGGLLIGHVIDAQGLAKPRTEVSIRQGDHEVVRTATDNDGVFAAQGLRGGNYELVTEQGSCSCRLWAAETAPPAARPAALVVCGNDVVRGQYGPGGMVGWVKAHPYITAGVVAAAIATPLAFIDDDDDDDEGS
jgi:hypothetical protein